MAGRYQAVSRYPREIKSRRRFPLSRRSVVIVSGVYSRSVLRISLLLLIILTAGCSLPLKKTGFVDDQASASPGSKSYLGPRPPVDIAQPGDKTIIIYNHGTTRPQLKEDCDSSWNRVPDSLLALQNEEVSCSSSSLISQLLFSSSLFSWSPSRWRLLLL